MTSYNGKELSWLSMKQLGGRVRDRPVGAVSGNFAAGFVDVAKERGDDRHLPVAADSQNPLEIGDGRRHGDFVSDDDFTNYVEFVVGEFDDLGNNTIAVRLAERRIVQTVNDHWCLSRQGEAVGLNLRKGSGDGGGVEDPAALSDRVRDESDVGGCVGQPVRVAAANEEGGDLSWGLGEVGRESQLP
jgi:hypothetical protein